MPARPGGPDDTSSPAVTQVAPGEYRVPELDPIEKEGPQDLRQVEGAGRGLCDGSPVASRPPFPSASKVIDMQQGTRTRPHTRTTAPAVVATRASLRQGVLFVFPCRSAHGRTSAPEGGEMA